MPEKNKKTRKSAGRLTKELYLKVPYHILNISGLSSAEKNLLAHIYSFGAKGCWQSNKTLAEIFMTSKSSISRKIKKIRSYIYVKSPKGYYRTIWAKSHPDVCPRSCLSTGRPGGKNAQAPAQNGSPDLRKSAIRLTHKCATTNNNTIKENNKDISATPSPLPAHGQAPALLTERKKQIKVDLEQFKQKFGIGKKKFKPLPVQEFERCRAAQIKAISLLCDKEK